ncbi:sensor histidine kinase [Thermovenabulum sp.]|uniref:sensor histidine kinase n=1 Tax=Thermovenabulum sp. TaxID=3100335 RepID=UPI003C7A984F
MIELSYLDSIIQKVKQVVENSKEEIYNLSENARQEYERAKKELEQVKEEIKITIEEVDQLEKEYIKARMKLMEVSRNFKFFKEEDIKNAYEVAHSKQIELINKREKEKLLRNTRDHLERYIKNVERTIKRSEELMININMVIKILNNELSALSDKIGELQQFQALGLSVISAQEEERRRIARDIHDGPAQSLANIVMRSEYILKLMEVNPSMVKEELFALIELVRKSLADVRKIIFDLRPMSLDDLGLLPALKRYIEQYQKEYGIFVEMIVMGREYDLDSSIAIAVFRIIQESLNNVRKYAKATEVIIKLEYLSEKINGSVRDNGCGFDVEKALTQKEGSAFGIMGMRERVQLLNGKFEIRSVIGKGTEVIFSIPVKKK